MRTTAIVNLKGGVAKTVTAVNMAAILAHDHKQRVLVIDADSQCNTTAFFGGVLSGACTLGDLLRGTDVNPVIRASNVAGVDLIAASDNLMDLDLSAVRSKTADADSLRKLLFAHRDDYDHVLIDCPPAFNAASAAALVAAHDVVIPIKLDAFSLRGMANLMRQIDNMRRINPQLRLAGVLPTMTYKSDKIRGALDTLYRSGLHVYPKIRRTGKVDDMTFAQTPLIVSSPKSAACIDYRRLVRAYMAQEAETSGDAYLRSGTHPLCGKASPTVGVNSRRCGPEAVDGEACETRGGERIG